MDRAFFELLSYAPLGKYFHIYRKPDLLASVRKALTSVGNDFTLRRKDQDADLTICKRQVKKSHFVLKHSIDKPVYFINQFGEFKLEDDKANTSEYVLVLKTDRLLIDPKSISNEYHIIQFLRDLQIVSNIFDFYPNVLTLSQQIRESIQEGINTFRRRLNNFLLVVRAILNRKYDSNHGIGKGIEGYIPFITWARGSLISQLVSNLVSLDKLSHPNNYISEITYGYKIARIESL